MVSTGVQRGPGRLKVTSARALLLNFTGLHVAFALCILLFAPSFLAATSPHTNPEAVSGPPPNGDSAVAAAFQPDTATTTSGLPLSEGGRGGKPVSVSGKLTTGINEAFQLTLGGLFSDGVNFQNTATVDVKNLLADGGTLRFTGILHLDTGGAGRDWIGAVNYIHPLATWESGKLVGTVGLHVWQFPSVLNGKTDTVVDSGLTWVQSGPISFTADANVKTLTTGPGRIGVGGQIYYFRGTTSHPLIRKPKLSLALVHGPSYTYSNRFYGVNGHRVVRYEAGAVLQYGNWGIDAMYRPQLALQRGIPENRFWGINLFYSFD